MSESITTHRMYKFRLYRNDNKDKSLRHKLFVASLIWNHFSALQRRYYKLTGKYISLKDINNHVLKLRNTKRYKRARRELAKQHAHVADKRRDFQFKLAHRLCGEYDILYFEDLNLDGMKRLWGRKVSDLDFGKFITRLEWVALKRGKIVVKIDRFERTTQKCSRCKRSHSLTLRDRVLNCPCGLTIDRDHNAAINIKCVGASAHDRSDGQTRGNSRGRVEGRRPRL